MELNSNLLNEVIADAKAVRETAVQTAISRLKETFEPTVRNLISQKLREDEGEEFEDDDTLDMSSEAPAPESAPEEPAPEMGFGEEPSDDFDDDDLDEILRELEGSDDSSDHEEDMTEVHGDSDYKKSSTHYSGLAEEDDMEDESISSEELDEMISELETELAESWVHNWGQKEYDPADDFESIYESRRSPKRTNRSKTTSNSSTLVNENRKLKQQLSEAKSQLKTALRAITTQKTAINEVNLLNSKLLFLTKITSKHKLSPEKQVKVLEAFDRAQTIREVKLVYATISESLDKAQTAKLNGIVESVSKPIRTVKGNLNENYNFVSRWQELAGIKK